MLLISQIHIQQINQFLGGQKYHLAIKLYKTYADKSYDELCSILRRELERLNKEKVK
jgi:hypothetical protein